MEGACRSQEGYGDEAEKWCPNIFVILVVLWLNLCKNNDDQTCFFCLFVCLLFFFFFFFHCINICQYVGGY